MKHIESEVLPVHKPCETVFKVGVFCCAAEHCKTRKPAVACKQRRAVDRFVCIILSEIHNAESRSEHRSNAEKQRKPLFQQFDDRILPEHKVSKQKHQTVKAEPVHADDRRVENLRSRPDRYCKQNQPDRVDSAADPLQTIPFDFTDQQQHYGKYPQKLNIPEHACSAQQHDQKSDRCGNILQTVKCINNRHVHPTLYELERKQSDG